MLQELFKKHLGHISQTTLLTGMGVSGVITTAYLTGRASFKAAEIISRKERKLEKLDVEKMTTKDKVKEVWPLYVAPVSVGATTITCIIMSNKEASKKIAALTVASGISERALTEYKAKVVEKFGENKEMAVRDDVARDKVASTPINKEVLVVGAGDVLCFDLATGRYFQSTVEKIRQAENKINFDIISHNYASLSAFYDELDIAPTPYSDTVGWNVDNHVEVQFSTVMSPDQRPCVAIDFAIPPKPDYDRLW